MEERTVITIGQFVDRKPISVAPGDAVQTALGCMAEHNIGAVLVTDLDQLVGIFTERDAVTVFARGGTKPLREPVSAVMTPDPVTVDVRDAFHEVYAKMKALHARHLPILDIDTIVGIVSMRDLLHTYQNILVAQYEDTRRRLDEARVLIGLDDDDRVRTLAEEVERYKRLSMTDALTGLYNKRYFQNRLDEEVARARRHDAPLSVVFADIDYFKGVNDEHGHRTGDEVLRQVGAILAAGVEYSGIVSRLRKSDIVARYGGEEFVVILPETPLAGAIITSEKLRLAIDDQIFRDDVSLTASFGVAELAPDVAGSDELVKRADIALYQAKASGRNRVEAYSVQ